MNEQQRTEKITVGNCFLRLLQGAVLGLASMIPFFQVKDLKETLGFRREDYGKETKFWDKVLYILAHRWAYLIGAISGIVIFFFIPVQSEITKFPMAYVGGLLALCLGFGGLEVYRYFHCDRTRKRDYISLGVFIGVIVLCFLLFNLIQEKESTEWLTGPNAILLMLLMTIGSFLVNFSGISISSFLFVSSSFVGVSTVLNNHLYHQTKEGVILFFCALYGIIMGYILNMVLNHYVRHLEQERHATNAAFFLSGLLLVCIYMIKEPYYGYDEDSYVTMVAQAITIASTVIGCLGVSVGLTIHGYKELNQKDYADLNDTEENR